MIAIVGGTIYTPDELIEQGVVLIDGGKIRAVDVAARLDVPEEAQIIEATSRYVVPGYVDVHTHGLQGHDVMGPGLAQAIPRYPQYGVTSFMATTFTLPEDRTNAALEAMAEVLEQPPPGARCLGIHVEGPHLSPARPGMATAKWFQPLTWEIFERLQQQARGHIRMITFAPEEGDAMGVIPQLCRAGVVPVIGHSDATFSQVEEAVALGLAHATHTFNAMRGLHHREPGVVGAVLYFDEIFAEFIADGVHLHPAAIELLLRAKGTDRAILISDSAPVAALPSGEYDWEHERIYVRDGRCELEDGTIAGAHALLDTGVRTLVGKLGLPLGKALVPATCTAADSVGAEAKGRIAPDLDADLVLLDEDLYPVRTLVEGQTVWVRQ